MRRTVGRDDPVAPSSYARLFIAVNFREPTRRALTALQAELRQSAARGSFTPPQNLHLTLAFLGECDEVQTEAAKEAMMELDHGSFSIEIDCLGRFRRDDGDIWWAGVGENAHLLRLQGDLTDKLKAQGFTLESRVYTPHITLARRVAANLQEKTVSPFGETVTNIYLMKSEHIGGRLIYTPVWEKGLAQSGGSAPS